MTKPHFFKKKNIFFQIIFCISLIYFLKIHLQSNTTSHVVHAPETFGKTHFISGFTNYKTKNVLESPYTKETGSYRALFSQTDDICKALCDLIQHEQTEILIAIYTITDIHITRALIDAKKRGVRIEIITDRSSPLDRFTKIGMLHAHNIPIFLYQPPLKNDIQKGLMHNKFAIFSRNKDNKQIIWSGSFNFTASGYKYNRENVIIIEDDILYKQFLKEFALLKQQSVVHYPQS